ncbi:hypothetical protein NEDG_01274 [Nematocida displodere]|uniref:Mitochondrial import inner membrane translocase subunit TIM50 n=1 Tax=Nematocida displodere TaxID=1805483 RepID=A0A177ECF9_9MICR|nr:hypothetical protein NEDG_01274 [Nematocida displodere]
MIQERVFVFDLNGTLVTRVKENKREYLQVRDADERLRGCDDLIYVRPHLKELARFLHTYAIPYVFWTTAMEHNGAQLLSIVSSLGMNQHKLALFGTHATPIPGHPYKKYKDLSVLSTMLKVPLETLRLIDDEEIKSIQKDQFIKIDCYDPKNTQDTALVQLIDTLKAELGLGSDTE